MHHISRIGQTNHHSNPSTTMESNKPNSSPCYFLPELQIEVLLRLPVKSLVRFVSVSKTWHSLIKDSTFIRKKHNLSHENAADKQRLLVHGFMPEPTLSMHEDKDSFCRHYVTIETPPFLLAQPELKRRAASPTYYDSYVCDGEILCVLFDNKFILWNPSIEKTIWVPDHIGLDSLCHYGFGFDTETNDYKVLRIGYATITNSRLKRAQVFSLREGYWRDIVGEPLQHSLHSFGSKSINLNGFIYWIIQPGNKKGRDWILAFHLGFEKFVKINANLPNSLAYESQGNSTKLELIVFEKSISLFRMECPNHCRYDHYNRYSLWVMKEKDVWIMLWSCGPALMIAPLAFRLNGELLMETIGESGDRMLYSWN